MRDVVTGHITEVADVQTASFERAVALLSDKDVITVMTAVRRLGGIGGEREVEIIVRNFHQRPYCDSGAIYRSMDPVKLDTLRTLGRVHTPKAKKALLDIARHYWNAGPRTSAFADCDWEFQHVIAGTCHQLERWADDDEVHAFACRIASDPHLYERLDGITFVPYVLKLKDAGSMRKAGITNLYDVATNTLHLMYVTQHECYPSYGMLLNEIPAPILSNLYASADADAVRANDAMRQFVLENGAGLESLEDMTEEQQRQLRVISERMKFARFITVVLKDVNQPKINNWDVFGPLD